MKHGHFRVLNIWLILIVLLSTALASGGLAGQASAAANWEQLGAGESRWYSFEYAGDRSQIEIQLQADQAGSVSFKVYTPDQMQRLNGGDRAQPIGESSEDSRSAGVLSWSGNFPTAGTYGVLVERAGYATGTISYSLSVTGSGVTFIGTTPTAKTQPASTQTTTATTKLAAGLAGKILFQTSYGGAFYTINADGTGLKRVGTGIDPTWSPDGTQIAYVSWTDPRGVWVVNSDGTNAHRVFDWTETRYPSWSPDGQQIVFSRISNKSSSSESGSRNGPRLGKRGGPPGVGGPGGGGSSGGTWTLGYVNAGDGTFEEPQPASKTNLTPDWSPDGQSIVFAGWQGLEIQSIDGKESRQLTTDPRDTSPVWSPDGTKVAYAHRQNDHWEIYVVDVATGQSTRLTNTTGTADGSPASSVSPAWSPDGKTIAFLTNTEGKWNIWVMSADGTQAGPMFSTALNGLTISYAFAGERAIDWVK